MQADSVRSEDRNQESVPGVEGDRSRHLWARVCVVFSGLMWSPLWNLEDLLRNHLTVCLLPTSWTHVMIGCGVTYYQWLVPEDISFFRMLSKHGKTLRLHHEFVGGAISNATNAKNIPRKKRYEAACHVHAACGSCGLSQAPRGCK